MRNMCAVEHYYDNHAINVLVQQAIKDAPRGTQAELARHVGVPPATVNRWAKRLNCPGHEHWPAIESFFGWPAGTIEGVGGVGPSTLGQTEAAILGDKRFTEDQRMTLLAVAERFVKDNERLAEAQRLRQQPTSS